MKLLLLITFFTLLSTSYADPGFHSFKAPHASLSKLNFNKIKKALFKPVHARRDNSCQAVYVSNKGHAIVKGRCLNSVIGFKTLKKTDLYEIKTNNAKSSYVQTGHFSHPRKDTFMVLGGGVGDVFSFDLNTIRSLSKEDLSEMSKYNRNYVIIKFLSDKKTPCVQTSFKPMMAGSIIWSPVTLFDSDKELIKRKKIAPEHDGYVFGRVFNALFHSPYLTNGLNYTTEDIERLQKIFMSIKEEKFLELGGSLGRTYLSTAHISNIDYLTPKQYGSMIFNEEGKLVGLNNGSLVSAEISQERFYENSSLVLPMRIIKSDFIGSNPFDANDLFKEIFNCEN